MGFKAVPATETIHMHVWEIKNKKTLLAMQPASASQQLIPMISWLACLAWIIFTRFFCFVFQKITTLFFIGHILRYSFIFLLLLLLTDLL